MKEREISLVDLIFDILLKWRVIVALMLVGAVVLGAFGYVQSSRTSKSQEAQVREAQALIEQTRADSEAQAQSMAAAKLADETKRLEDLEQLTLKDLEASLTDVQKDNVNNIFAYEGWLADRLRYGEQSVLLQMDSNHVQKADLTFKIVASDVTQNHNIEKVYEDIVVSGQLFEAIAEVLEVPVETVNEIVRLERASNGLVEGTDTLRVSARHFDEQKCSLMVETIIDFVEKKHEELVESLGAHEVLLVNQSMSAITDANVLAMQKQYVADIHNFRNTIKSLKAALVKEEIWYYDLLKNGEITDLSRETLTAAAAATPTPAPANANTEELTPEEIVARGITVQPGISGKYIILGMLLAAFVYVFVFFLLYVMNGRLRATDKLSDLYDLRQIGQIPAETTKKKFMSFVDDWIITLRDRNKRKFSPQEAYDLATAAVKLAANKEEADTVYFIGCDLKDYAAKVCEKLKECLGKEQIQVKILNNVLYNAQSMKDLEDARVAVLVEKAGSTLYTEIAQEMELLDGQGVKILGGIIVE